MKNTFRLILILTLALVPFQAFAQEGEQATAADRGNPGPWIFTFYGTEYVVPGALAADGTVETKAELGLYGASSDDSPDMAAEYFDTESGPTMNATVSSHQKWGSLYFQGAYQSTSTNSGELDFDIRRTIRSKNDYGRFLHRLGHDPMENLEATSFNGKVVWHTDLDPDQEYQFNYTNFESRTEIQLPSIKALTVGVGFREQARDGHRQAFTVSHCDNCHMYSQSHTLNESTSDVVLDAKVAWKGGYAKAAFDSRSLRYGGYNSVNMQDDDALHPELQKPVFDNRLQYDSDVGVVPADLWPDSDKDRTRLDLVFNDLGGFTLTANGVWSQTENRNANLKSNYTGYIATLAKGWKSGWRFRWRGRAYSIDNDDIFIDVNDRPSIAGPHAGQTYEDVYGFHGFG